MFVPSINKSFDTYITCDSKVSDIKYILSKSIETISNDMFIESENIIVDSITGCEYNDNLLIKETNLENGSKVILI